MREVLFRGKRVDNGEWVEGIPVPITINSYPTNRIELVRSHSYDELDNFHLLSDDEEIIPETLSQYTGSLDKNSVKIFEGDIVLVPMYRTYTAVPNFMKGTIEWKNGAFHVTWDDDMYGRHFVGYLEDMEVIGNIFDNPELREEQA